MIPLCIVQIADKSQPPVLLAYEEIPDYPFVKVVDQDSVSDKNQECDGV